MQYIIQSLEVIRSLEVVLNHISVAIPRPGTARNRPKDGFGLAAARGPRREHRVPLTERGEPFELVRVEPGDAEEAEPRDEQLRHVGRERRGSGRPGGQLLDVDEAVGVLGAQTVEERACMHRSRLRNILLDHRRVGRSEPVAQQ